MLRKNFDLELGKNFVQRTCEFLEESRVEGSDRLPQVLHLLQHEEILETFSAASSRIPGYMFLPSLGRLLSRYEPCLEPLLLRLATEFDEVFFPLQCSLESSFKNFESLSRIASIDPLLRVEYVLQNTIQSMSDKKQFHAAISRFRSLLLTKIGAEVTDRVHYLMTRLLAYPLLINLFENPEDVLKKRDEKKLESLRKDFVSFRRNLDYQDLDSFLPSTHPTHAYSLYFLTKKVNLPRQLEIISKNG